MDTNYFNATKVLTFFTMIVKCSEKYTNNFYTTIITAPLKARESLEHIEMPAMLKFLAHFSTRTKHNTNIEKSEAKTYFIQNTNLYKTFVMQQFF